mgnify:CR=1 FL=1
MVARGRPRSFDRHAALTAAMETFWRLGYEGASMAALTEAMGINSPSLYAAFGSKEALFREAVELYLASESSSGQAILDGEKTAREAFHAILRHTIEKLVRPDMPHGCLLVLGDSNATPQNSGIRTYLCQCRRDSQAMLEARLKRGVRDGDIPAGADIANIAAYYMTMTQGLSLRARDGASRAALMRIADAAMAGWDALVAAPTSKRKRA